MSSDFGLNLEDAHIAVQPLRAGKLVRALAAAACFVAVALAGYASIALLPLPGYGTWTGIRPLENKLAQLERFCAEGPVDAIALGSSIVDFGFSADMFSSLMSRDLGHPYRVFNFATGGAEVRTLPSLYRFARTACKPRAIFVIAPAEQRLREEISAGSPDHALLSAPVGPALHSQRLLELDKSMWSQPILKYAPAARDLFLFGGYRNLRAGMDSYEVDSHGDRKSFLMTWKLGDVPRQKKVNEVYVTPLPGDRDDPRVAEEHFFAKRDLAAMRELRRLAAEDGAAVYLFSHAGAATYYQGVGDSGTYLEGRRQFYRAFSQALGAKLVDVDDRVDIPWYAISDTTHLNIYGARIYTRAAFDAFAGGREDAEAIRATQAMQPPPRDLFPTTDHSFNAYAALLRRPANEADPLLRFRMVDSSDVPPLPDVQLYAALRTSDNRDVVAPAVAIGPHEFVADVGLPARTTPEGVVFRLVYDEGSGKVAAMNTLAEYEWVHSFPSASSMARSQPPLIAWPPLRKPGDALYLGVRAGTSIPANVGLALQPRTGGASIELDAAHLVPGGPLVAVHLPAATPAGDYILRLRDAANGEPLAISAPVEVNATGMQPHTARVAVEGKPSVAAGHVKVRWSGIAKPHKHDWVGLFPVGSGPGGRLDIVFTDSKPDGEMDFPLSPSVVPRLVEGQFEFRLYAAGGWLMLAHSEPFTFDVPGSVKAAMGHSGPVVDPSPGSNGVRVFSEKEPRLALGAVRVGWAGIAAPSEQDWVGLFPVGGSDQSRLDFTFTKGKADGQLDFPISPALTSRLESGQYEFRLYSAGGWTMLAKSEPLRFSSAK